MRADLIRKYLEKPGNITAISQDNMAKLPLGEQMILSLVLKVVDEGNPSAFKTLYDAAYGVMRPGDGPDRDLTEKDHYQATFQGLDKEKNE